MRAKERDSDKREGRNLCAAPCVCRVRSWEFFACSLSFSVLCVSVVVPETRPLSLLVWLLWLHVAPSRSRDFVPSQRLVPRGPGRRPVFSRHCKPLQMLIAEPLALVLYMHLLPSFFFFPFAVFAVAAVTPVIIGSTRS